MIKTVWKLEFVIRVYELIKSGMSENKASKALGISLKTFNKWEVKKPAFKMAVKMGRRARKSMNGKGITFRDYVYDRLPRDLKKIWKKVNKLDESKCGGERIEAILSKRGVRVRQHLFMYAWTASNFSISQALRKVNLSRAIFDFWKKNDPEFAILVEEINWHKKNFFEDHLCKLIAGGDVSATIFANRTMNRDRGYNEKVDLNLSGTVEHRGVNVDLNKLSKKARKEILGLIRGTKKAG